MAALRATPPGPGQVVTAVKSGNEAAGSLTAQLRSLIQDDLGGIIHHQMDQSELLLDPKKRGSLCGRKYGSGGGCKTNTA